MIRYCVGSWFFSSCKDFEPAEKGDGKIGRKAYDPEGFLAKFGSDFINTNRP
jgi:hypothetical protein